MSRRGRKKTRISQKWAEKTPDAVRDRTPWRPYQDALQEIAVEKLPPKRRKWPYALAAIALATAICVTYVAFW